MEEMGLIKVLSRFALVPWLVAGLGVLAPAAQAAPVSAAPMIGAALSGMDAGLLEDVRYVTRCRPVVITRRDRMGRPVRVQREQCRRVWVGRR